MDVHEIKEVLDKAHIQTMGGDCVTAAIAINKVLLDGGGEYVIATNLHLNEKYPDKFDFESPFIGHMAVLYKNHLIDGRGTLSRSEFEEFGDVSKDDKDFASSYPNNMGLNYDEAKDADIVFIEEPKQIKNALKNTRSISSIEEKKEKLRKKEKEVDLREIIREEVENVLRIK